MKISKVLTFLTFQTFFSGDAFTNLNIVRTIPKKRISLVDSTADSNGKKDDIEMPLSIKYYGDVSTQNCLFLTETLKKMDYQSKIVEIQYGFRPPIKLHLQSHGGELLPSFYVCDFIQNLETPVHIYIDGYVASAASLIAVCGKKRIMTKHSFILIHQLKSKLSGKFNEMEDEIRNLNFFMDNLKNIYLNNSNISSDKLNKLLATDIWISAEECLSLGLIDEII
jgi:ATP-dependent protease ClpP protease subunit